MDGRGGGESSSAAMSKSGDDPRNAALEVKFSFPNTWAQEAPDLLSTSGMFLSGLIMVTRNRFLAWPSLVFGINSSINAHPMRVKDGGSGSLPNLALSFTALVATYIPLFMVSTTPKPAGAA
uniref:Uncharacterized protein n=1 Tax=Mycena chlorophos TaxID=658473 RepID=A0ABQ0L0S9_MYCCL|nr:predicted protein [Mycena chlorophos]